MKNCPKCGATVKKEAKFCNNCGFDFTAKMPYSKECIIGFISSIACLICVHVAVITANLWGFSNGVYAALPYVFSVATVALCVVGLIFSSAGMKKAKKYNMRGRALAVPGTVISSIIGGTTALIGLIAGLFLTILAAMTASLTKDYEPSSTRRYEETTWYTEPTYTEPTYTEDDLYETYVEPPMTFGTGCEKIKLWSYTDEVPKMVGLYIKQNPEFGEKYTVECTIIYTDGGAYQAALDKALVTGGDNAPDIYTADAAFVVKYTQGDLSSFASTYKDLGIDVKKKIKEADIAQYSVDIGTRDGEVVALGYQGTGSAMIYNAEVAKDVFGTDDPAEIEKIVGAGSGNWDKFLKASEKLKEKGYAAVSGPEDIWKACEKSADKPWQVDGELYIDPKREKYIDLAKTITDNGYSNGAQQWSEPWYTDMKGEGEHKVFAFFGPAWLINYVMMGNSGGNKVGEGTYGQWRVCAPPVGYFWGGAWLLANKDTDQKEGVAELIEWITLDTSETGLQYLWANGFIDWDNDPGTTTPKDTVASGTVMAKSDGTLSFCGEQNIFPAYIAANKSASAKACSQYDETISNYWMDCVNRYINGEYNREEAIEYFRNTVKENLNL